MQKKGVSPTSVNWPVVPVIPSPVAPGEVITAGHENGVVQALADLWTDVQAVGSVTLADPTTAKGDLLVRDTAALARLAVGPPNAVLTADPGQTLGVGWSTSVYVPPARRVNAGAGLTGGGPLSADVTLAVLDDSSTQRLRVSHAAALVGTRREINFIDGANVALALADDAANNRLNVTINASGGVPATRQIIAGAGMSGGGPLSADVTLAANVTSVMGRTGDVALTAADVTAAGGVSSIRAYQSGSLIGTRPALNFIPGANITLAVVDNPGSTRVDVTISAAGGASGMADPTTTKGDLIARGDNPPATRLAVGTNGQVLTADSSATLGVKWANPASQSPWTGDINASGFKLGSVGAIGIGAAASTTGTRLLVQASTTDEILAGTNVTATGRAVVNLSNDSGKTALLGAFGSNYAVASLRNNFGFFSSQDYVFCDSGFTERVRFGASGNVGIGNDLSVLPRSPDTDINLLVGSRAAGPLARVTVAANASVGASIGTLAFANYAITATEKRVAQIVAQSDGALDSGAMLFQVWAAGVQKEAMRVTSAGNVGIGAASPVGRVMITSDNTWAPGNNGLAGIALNTSGNFGGGIGMTDGAATYAMYTQSGAWCFGTGLTTSALTERMRIVNNGNVHVGGTSSTYKFNVYGRSWFQAIGEQWSVGLTRSDATQNIWLGVATNGDFMLSAHGGGELFRITQAGLVGVGTGGANLNGQVSFASSGSSLTAIGMTQTSAVDNATFRIAGFQYAGGLQTAIDFIQNSASNFNSSLSFKINTGVFGEMMQLNGTMRAVIMGMGTAYPYSAMPNSSFAFYADSNHVYLLYRDSGGTARQVTLMTW